MLVTTDTNKMYIDNNNERLLLNPDSITNLSASGKTITYTKNDGTTGTITTQDTTYSVATSSANGLMSAAMVTKLNGFPSPASSDSGKFLRVNSNGAYTLMTVANAEEASF